jgi:hypothetical protein
VGIFKPNPKYVLTTTSPSTSAVPRAVRAAVKDPAWYAAMQEEYDALKRNQTWTLVPRPPDAHIISGRDESGVDNFRIQSDLNLNYADMEKSF